MAKHPKNDESGSEVRLESGRGGLKPEVLAAHQMWFLVQGGTEEKEALVAVSRKYGPLSQDAVWEHYRLVKADEEAKRKTKLVIEVPERKHARQIVALIMEAMEKGKIDIPAINTHVEEDSDSS